MPATLHIIFFFNDTATTEIYTLSLHDALPILLRGVLAQLGRAQQGFDQLGRPGDDFDARRQVRERSEEHTSELQSPDHIVCRLLLEKKKTTQRTAHQCYIHHASMLVSYRSATR